jgi:hypothetical protein
MSYECGCNKPSGLYLELDTIFYIHFTSFKKDSTEALIFKEIYLKNSAPRFVIKFH